MKVSHNIFAIQMTRCSENKLVSNESGSKKRHIGPLLALVLLSVMFFAVVLGLASPGNIQVLILEKGVWIELPTLPGTTTFLKVSDSSSIWVATEDEHGFSKLNHSRWTHFNISDFAKDSDKIKAFSLDGEVLWAVTSSTVVRFDGTSWKSYPEVVIEDIAHNIFAKNDRVWIINRKGTLWHFDGLRWNLTELQITEPQMAWEESSRPKVFKAPNGGLWLHNDGLWMDDGSGWNQVFAPSSVPVDYIGYTSERLWFKERFAPIDKVIQNNSERLLWISADGSKNKYVTRSDIGIGEDETMQALINQEGSLLVATNHTLVAYTGNSWNISGNIPPLPTSYYEIEDLVAYNDGKYVARAEVDQGLVSRARKWIIVVPFVFIAGMISLLTWFDREERKKRQQEISAATRAAGLVEINCNPVVEGQSIEPEDGVTGKKMAGYGLAYGLQLLVTAIVIFALTPFINLLTKIAHHSLILAVLLGILLLLGFIVLVTWALIRRLLSVYKELRAKGYKAAADKALKLHEKNQICADELHGTVLMYAGRLDEAETALKRYIAEKSASKNYMDGDQLCTLVAAYGRVLLVSGKLNESIDSFKKAIDISQKNFEASLGLAEAYLEKDQNISEALTIIEDAIARYRRSYLQLDTRMFMSHNWLRLYGARALALAKLGRFDNAEESLKLGFKKGGQNVPPELALLHYRAGVIYEMEEKREEALMHYKQAGNVDSKGLFGTMAKTKLAQS